MQINTVLVSRNMAKPAAPTALKASPPKLNGQYL
jgi:hypothetical protein